MATVVCKRDKQTRQEYLLYYTHRSIDTVIADIEAYNNGTVTKSVCGDKIDSAKYEYFISKQEEMY